MEQYNRGVLQAVRDAARLPFRHPVALFQCSVLFLLFEFAHQIDMTLAAPRFYFSDRIESDIANMNWRFSVLHLASMFFMLNLVLGWSRISAGPNDSGRPVGWWNIDRSAPRYILQLLGIGIILVVLFLFGMLVAIPVTILGGWAGMAEIASAIVSTGFELLFFWVGFQLSLSLVSTAVDKKPAGLFDAWMVNDGLSVRCALALWVAYKMTYCLQFILIWSTAEISLWHLTDALFHFAPDTIPSASTPPLWVILACSALNWMNTVWSVGFMALAYRRFVGDEAPQLQTASA